MTGFFAAGGTVMPGIASIQTTETPDTPLTFPFTSPAYIATDTAITRTANNRTLHFIDPSPSKEWAAPPQGSLNLINDQVHCGGVGPEGPGRHGQSSC